MIIPMSTPHRWLSPPSYGDGDNIWGGQNDFAIYGQGRVPVRELFVRNYNARFFGARGDGITDDTAAIQAACDAARLNGGGIVTLPAGICLVSARAHPNLSTQVCFWVGSNTLVRGSGPGATIIRLANNQPNQASIITNFQTVANTDVNISFTDFTIDGNASGQAGSVDAQYGINLFGVAGVTFNNMDGRNVYGINAGGNGPNGTPGEGMTFDLTGCSHVAYSQCRAYSDGVMNTSTGFSANACNDVSYVNCWAYGLRYSMGFTNWKCWSARYANCWAVNCGNDGFHSELCDGLFYVNCTSGGTTSPLATNPYAPSTVLGSVKGFQIFQSIEAVVSNCIAQKNSQVGLYIAGATGPVKVIGGAFTANTLYGIQCADAASVTQTTIKGRPVTAGNGSGEVWYNGALVGLNTFAPGAAVPVPATTVAFTNPFPFDAMVYITAGTVTAVALDGTTVFTATPCGVTVRQGGTITLTYTVAPTWKWIVAG